MKGLFDGDYIAGGYLRDYLTTALCRRLEKKGESDNGESQKKKLKSGRRRQMRHFHSDLTCLAFSNVQTR